MPSKHKLPASQRQGMTLVEVSVAIALSAFLLGIGISLVARLQRWDVQFRDDSMTVEQLANLGELIRRDVRAAVDVSLVSKQVLIASAPGDRQIRYELSTLGCQRVVEQPVGEEERRELFRVGSGVMWTLIASSGDSRQNVTITLEQPQPETSGTNTVRLLASANRGADLPAGTLATDEINSTGKD